MKYWLQINRDNQLKLCIADKRGPHYRCKCLAKLPRCLVIEAEKELQEREQADPKTTLEQLKSLTFDD